MMEPLKVLLGSLTYGQAALAAIVLFTVYTVGTVVYRLAFHPLRNIPGPKLAAATRWVETFWECSGVGGQFMWEYQRWHEKYGPIVRIGPNEVHIQDPTFYDVLFNQSRHSNKLKELEHRFNNELATFATSEHDVHRRRRAAINPFFSKRAIAQEAPNIQKHMDRLFERIETEFLGKDNVLNLNNMWGAFTGDVIANYCFDTPYDFILKPEFRADFSDAMANLLEPIHFVTQFSTMSKGLKLLPEWLGAKLMPSLGAVRAFNDEMKSQILRAKAAHADALAMGKNLDSPGADRPSLFTAILASDLPPAELSTKRLQHEAIAVIGAGIETTMYTLSVACFHILANPNILRKLQKELQDAIKNPGPGNMPALSVLEQLPYLTCVINEALRFAYGTPQRIPRLSPTPLVYPAPRSGGDASEGEEPSRSAKTYVLPVGTVVSMDQYTTSHDPVVFGPDPLAFRPERWENNARAPDGRPLTRYLVAFGRGTRSCVGMQLAYADLYIGLATFFRRLECELFETERDAVDLYMDRFVPRPKPGTKGVRVKVVRAL